MNESEVELSQGETVQIGDFFVTIIEIDGDEIHFRVDPQLNEGAAPAPFDMRRWIRPR